MKQHDKKKMCFIKLPNWISFTWKLDRKWNRSYSLPESYAAEPFANSPPIHK